MTGSRPEDNNRMPDEELDPTGVRHLLANLPDPGPMPEHLTARITESLQLEQQRRAGGGSPTGQEPNPVAGPAPVSLAKERKRRRPGRNLAWLGSAAAVAVAATVATSQLLGGDAGDSDVAAQYPQTSGNDAAQEADQDDSAADAGDEDGAVADADPPPAAEPEEGGADAEQEESPSAAWPGREDETDGSDGGSAGEVSSRVTVHTVTGSVHLTQDDLAAEVRDWAEAPMIGETTWTAEEVTTCITRSGVDSTNVVDVLASEAVLDGEAALLLVSTDGTPNAAWVLDEECSQVLAGPVRLD